MRLAKAQGLIAKIPGGRKPGVRIGVCDRVRSPAPSEARRQRIAEKEIEVALKDLPVAQKPDTELSKDEAFSEQLREALLHNLAILRRPIDWGDIEILKLKTTVALSVQSQAVRLRVAELSPRPSDGVVGRLMERVAKLRGEPVIEIEPDAKTVEPTG
jgi:hypothetical protein